jgi:antitoxin (DNA-binding transcriptional repressor) of toxin-antitoxin stability system
VKLIISCCDVFREPISPNGLQAKLKIELYSKYQLVYIDLNWLILVQRSGGMMKSIGAFQVKTHLSQILKDIEESGETVAITKHGKTVAILSPAPAQDPINAAIDSIRKNRSKVKLGKGLSVNELIKEGRK